MKSPISTIKGGGADRPSSRAPRAIRATETMHLPIEQLPALRRGTPAELAAVALQIGLPDSRATVAADDAGHLRFTEILRGSGTTAWVIADPSGRVAALRRLSGPALHDAAGRPVQSVLYGDRSWPVGASAVHVGQPVLLVRGAGDLLAAHHTGWLGYTIVAMLGDVRISRDALPLFGGRLMVLGSLRCPAARRAFAVWRQQLIGVARNVHTMLPVDTDGRKYYRDARGRIARNLLGWARGGYALAEAETRSHPDWVMG
jgi:hypothetical protein